MSNHTPTMCPTCFVGSGVPAGTGQLRCTECGYEWAPSVAAPTRRGGGTLPRFPSRPMDEVASLILDYLIAEGGEVQDQPGELLKTIAEATECDYFAVSVAVRQLEQIGFVQVERADRPDAHQGNRIARIALA